MIRAASLALLLAVSAGMASCKPAPRTITADDLRANPVIGDLGVPLGTVVRITGVAAAEDYRRSKGDSDTSIVFVRTVDGRSMPGQFEARLFRSGCLSDASGAPAPGRSFDLLVYESGGFVGIPDKALNYQQVIPQTIVGTHFKNELVIVAPGDATPVR